MLNCFIDCYQTNHSGLVIETKDVVSKYVISDPKILKVIQSVFSNSQMSPRGGWIQAIPDGGDLISHTLTTFSHPDLPEWLIKTQSKRTYVGGETSERTAFDNILRPFYRDKLIQVLRKLNLEKDFIFPEKTIVPAYVNSTKETDVQKFPEKFVVLSRKIEVLSYHETVLYLEDLHGRGCLRETLKKICQLVVAGIILNPSFHTIRFTKKGKIVFLNTNPHGLFQEKSTHPVTSPTLRIQEFANKNQQALKSSFYSALIHCHSQMGPFVLCKIVENTLESIFDEINDDPLYQHIQQQVFVVRKKWNWPLIAASITLLPPLTLLLYSGVKNIKEKMQNDNDVQVLDQ